jgi:hypothetical protein
VTNEEEQQILDDLGIEKSSMFGKCGTYRMPDINPTENKATATDDKKQSKSASEGGVFDGSTHEVDDVPLDLPTFISVQHD